MMVISIWPSRPTMRERAPWIRRTEFPAIERRATTYKKFRMRTTGQVRGDLRRMCLIPGRFGRIRILPGALFSRTTSKNPAQNIEKLGTREIARGADLGVGAAGKDNAETQSSRRFAESSGLVLVLGVDSFHVTGTRF